MEGGTLIYIRAHDVRARGELRYYLPPYIVLANSIIGKRDSEVEALAEL